MTNLFLFFEMLCFPNQLNENYSSLSITNVGTDIWIKSYSQELCINKLKKKKLAIVASAIKYIHSVVQLSPLSSSRIPSSPQKESPYSLSSHCSFSSFPSPWQPQICFLSLWSCLFWIFHINGIIYYVIFCIWFLSLNIVFSRSIYVDRKSVV